MFLIEISVLFLYAQNIVCAYSDDPGEPLILTPLIEQNEINQALAASEVNYEGFFKKRSYSGYFTVNKTYNSNLFFWFFPSENDFENAPVVLWLQGGPGASSLLGLFLENGPFVINSEETLKCRKYSWTKTHSVLYIDSPVGTGFSFTDEGGYAQNETKVGQDLYNALEQFFLMFPELQKNPFFVTGESYAGKYVPAVSYTIHNNNQNGKTKINLQGLAIGNGLSDPVNQLKFGDFLYQLGLIDTDGLDEFNSYEQQIIQYIQNEEWVKASLLFKNLMYGDLNGQFSLFANLTGFNYYYNFLYSSRLDMDMEFEKITYYIQRAHIRAAIHVGNTSFQVQSSKVMTYMVTDITKSVAPWISELLSYYRVLIYNGQLDILLSYPMTVNYLKYLEFEGSEEYKTAERYKWYVDLDLAGYFKQAGNLTEVLVRNAGHLVPQDQPEWAFDLINRFTRNKPLYTNST